MEFPWYWGPSSFFDGTPAELKPAVLAQARRLEVKRGKLVFAADDGAEYVYYLERGLVKIYHLASSGEVTIFWFCTAGELFGPGGMTGAAEQAVYAQAASHSVIYAIVRQDYERLLHTHPQLGINTIKLLGGRMRLACDAVVDKNTQRAEARLARILLRLARHWGEVDGSEIRFGMAITQQEMANMAGTCRQTINTTLRSFEADGLIRFDGRTLVIGKPDELAALIG
jgi:CRP-like cAMP-binding protein